MDYLLSIVIPTKNRFNYLIECLSAIIDIGSDKIEIVVQDNSDNMEVEEYIRTLNWPHIKYFYESKKLSQTGNSELAVEHSTGKYVCYIGDDDAVATQLIEVVKLMEKYSIDACTFDVATYNWPDVIAHNPKIIPFRFNKSDVRIKKIDSKQVLSRYLSNGMQEIKLLPRVYHGILSKEILEEIKTRTGSYFPGPSPDMANATAASLIVRKFFKIGYPLIIDGKSYKSAGGMGLRGAHTGKLTGVSQLSDDVEANWNARIPKLWLGRTIWPESCIKALEAMQETEYINKMNWHAIYARILLRNSEYANEVREHLHTINDYIKVGFVCLERMYKYAYAILQGKIKRLLKTEYVCNETITISQAIKITEKSFCKEEIIKKS
ncbi:glycosyltransferase family 2 protein [Bacillus coahuilensis]|uniref:glycosyltransferase family 2 protein n=1 Tax=Bacillus coahuilensis TaxID=408580 RepID=UPI000185138C|nr:glycosyltransferase family 2 protein [Bacillus coahuilensis]